MEPRFRDGELIFVDPDVEPEHGTFVVVRTEGSEAAFLRQLSAALAASIAFSVSRIRYATRANADGDDQSEILVGSPRYRPDPDLIRGAFFLVDGDRL